MLTTFKAVAIGQKFYCFGAELVKISATKARKANRPQTYTFDQSQIVQV